MAKEQIKVAGRVFSFVELAAQKILSVACKTLESIESTFVSLLWKSEWQENHFAPVLAGADVMLQL